MDDQQTQRMNEAAQKFAGVLVESYRTVSGRTASAQQLGAELTQHFFNAVISNLYSRAESNRAMMRELADQQERQLEVSQAFAQESVNAYMAFVNSMFSFYRRTAEEAERGTGE